MTFFQIVLINLGALITALGGVFLKRLSVALPDGPIYTGGIVRVLLNLNLWLGGVCYVLPIFFWVYLLRSMELTKLQPILSIVYVYTIGIAYFLLGEQPSTQRIIGIVIVIVGVILVGRS